VFRPGGYADLRGLRGLAPAAVAATATTVRDGAEDMTIVRLRNVAARGTPAFFLRADVRRGRPGGGRAGGDDEVLPVTWTLDDVTLLRGETAVLVARYRHDRLAGAPPVVTVSGFNLRARTLPAPLTPPAAAAILRPWPSGSTSSTRRATTSPRR
jgi:exo-1,4-beta-D-glucosaminidase